MNKLTIVFSGRKQSGKNSSANYVRAKFLNKMSGLLFGINSEGNLIHNDKLIDDVEKYALSEGCKLYSFADPLKQFCINVFGAKYEQMYGTDAQKNSIIEHLVWENLPDIMRPFTVIRHPAEYLEFSGSYKKEWEEDKYKTGPMTGRELMQIFGTEMVRRLYHDAWARATYSSIQNDAVELALVTDGRFPNEMDMGKSVNAKTVRLLRDVNNGKDTHASETALDNYPLEKYSLVIDNTKMSLEEQCKFFDPHIDQWFAEAGIQ